jgi:hypothetical protein
MFGKNEVMYIMNKIDDVVYLMYLLMMSRIVSFVHSLIAGEVVVLGLLCADDW